MVKERKDFMKWEEKNSKAFTNINLDRLSRIRNSAFDKEIVDFVKKQIIFCASIDYYNMTIKS